MSRRSPDRDRDRDRDRARYQDHSSSSSERRHSRGSDDCEPGQIDGRREWQVERAPQGSPPLGLGWRSYPPRERERDRNRDSDRQKAVPIALEGFSRTLHSTLLSTSTHALATQHLTRMLSFPIPPSGIPSSSLADAQNRLRAAEVELGERMRVLHTTFDALMNSYLARAAVPSRASSESRDWDRDTDKERDLSKAEMDEVRERMRILEHRLRDVPPPPPPTSTSRKGKERATGEQEGIEGKRSRAKFLLEDMLTRIQVLEGLKEELYTRCNDLEDLVNGRIQDDMGIVSIGNDKWKDFEDMRDPDGVIRGLKRKRDDVPPPHREDTPLEPADVKHNSSTTTASVWPNMSGPDTAIATLQAQMASIRSEKSEITQLRAQVNSLKTPISPKLVVNSDNTMISALQKQVEALQTELGGLKEEQKKLASRAEADTKALDELKLHCEAFVKTQILQTVNKMANTASLSTSAKAAPSNGNSPRLPSVPFDQQHPQRQQHQLQQQSLPLPQEQGGNRSGPRRAKPFTLHLPLPLPTPSGWSQSLTDVPALMTHPQSLSQPSPQPDLQKGAHTQAQMTSSQTGMPATDTSRTVPDNLAPKQTPRLVASSNVPAIASNLQRPHHQQPEQQPIPSEQRKRASQSDSTSASHSLQAQTSPFDQRLSASNQEDVPRNPASTGSSLLAEWVDQRIKYPYAQHQSSYEPSPSTQNDPQQQHDQQQQRIKHHPPLKLSSSRSETNPLNPLMQVSPPQSSQVQSQAQPPNGTRFPGIENSIKIGQGRGKLVQQMSNAVSQDQGQQQQQQQR